MAEIAKIKDELTPSSPVIAPKTEKVDKVEKQTDIIVEHRTPAWMGALAAVGLLISLIALAWAYSLQSHISSAESSLSQANAQNAQLKEQVQELGVRLQSQGEALGQKVGITQQQLAERANALIAEQKNTSVATSKLAQHQNVTDQKIEAVQSDVAAVRTDVTAVKSDVATTQADLISTKKQITKVSEAQKDITSDIATNRKELNALKQRGDRTFYEFAIEKGAPAINLGTIKLSLKKVDEKTNRFNLVIGSDDKNIEKDNQTLNQAITFYSGKNPELFEIVVNGISKKMIAGYLSVPKDAPRPMIP